MRVCGGGRPRTLLVKAPLCLVGSIVGRDAILGNGPLALAARAAAHDVAVLRMRAAIRGVSARRDVAPHAWEVRAWHVRLSNV